MADAITAATDPATGLPHFAEPGADSLGDRLFATVPEAAAVLRSDPRSVRRAIAAGDIPAVPVGPRKLVPVAWLRQVALIGSA